VWVEALTVALYLPRVEFVESLVEALDTEFVASD
jgi:hypothetical protein